MLHLLEEMEATDDSTTSLQLLSDVEKNHSCHLPQQGGPKCNGSDTLGDENFSDCAKKLFKNLKSCTEQLRLQPQQVVTKTLLQIVLKHKSSDEEILQFALKLSSKI